MHEPIDITRIRPMAGKILVRRLPYEDKTDGGLYVPDVAKGRYGAQTLKRARGTVLAVGEGTRKMVPTGRWKEIEGEDGKERVACRTYNGLREPMDLRVGDVVVFSILRDGGDCEDLGHDDLTILNEDDIDGVIEED